MMGVEAGGSGAGSAGGELGARASIWRRVGETSDKRDTYGTTCNPNEMARAHALYAQPI